MNPQIVFNCKENNLTLDDIYLSFTDKSNLVLTKELEDSIEDSWREDLEIAKVQNRDLWDGTTFRINKLKISEKKVDIEISTMSFKQITGLRKIMRVGDIAEASIPKHISCGGIIKTTDDFYIIGVRSGKTMSTSTIDLIGGGASKDEFKLENSKDLLNIAIEEMEQETGIDKTKIEASRLLGLILSPTATYIFIFQVDLSISRDDADRIFKENHDNEMSNLLFLKKEDLTAKLDEAGGYRVLLNALMV